VIAPAGYGRTSPGPSRNRSTGRVDLRSRSWRPERHALARPGQAPAAPADRNRSPSLPDGETTAGGRAQQVEETSFAKAFTSSASVLMDDPTTLSVAPVGESFAAVAAACTAA
jgi:hypothetical protein